ncbi:SpaA isopeptide-forming pilin-related protein [Lactococcus lactis]|uniref:SpaA isopeptide-forming pilin-related protein n=1 Tax=Lactococcus lactis TaxID=1358 RepID=UPI00223B6490|nr:SpaA isopeptide-forming pilin-related protein [Lactococcus lactis]MCT1170620.1 LPXTG cell wall anchor domain-containing protein [Lactococcus lactis]
MKSRKKVISIILGLMLLLQYVITPVGAIAGAINEETNDSDITLSQFKIDESESNADLMTFDLSLKINQSTLKSKTTAIELDKSIKINEPNEVNRQKSTASYTADENRLTIDLNSINTSEVKINFSISKELLKNFERLTAKLNDSQVDVLLPKTSSTSEAPSQSTSTVTQNTVTPEIKEKESTTTKHSEQAKKSVENQDIRKLLEESGISPATIIDSAKLIYLDKEGKPYPDQTDVPIDAEVQIDYTWSIPEDILPLKSGDYFDFKLPDGVTIEQATSSLGDYGTYTVSADGTVRFVFNEKVENYHDINGTFHYDAHFDKTIVPGEVVIDTPTEENFPPSEIHVRPNYDQAIDKSGHFDKTPNPSKVIWEININRPLNTMENATLTDPMPEGTTYESVEIYPETVGKNGEIISIDKEHPLVKGTDYTVDSNGKITFIGKYATTEQAFNVVYTTTIDESSILEKEGTVSFKNTATLNDGKTDTNASASVTAQYKGPIKKNGPFTTGNDQIYNWNIEYNYNEKNHKAGAFIEDNMSDAIELVNGSVKLYKITFDSNGKEIKGAQLKEGEDYKLVQDPNNPQKFKIEFITDIDYAVKVEYQTKVKDIVDGNVTIDNSVTTDTGDNSESGGNATQQGIVKNIDGAIDYENREIPWKIDINSAGYWMENWSLEDKMSEGLTFLENTFQIIDKTAGNKVLSPTEYTLVKTATGFSVSFNSPLKEGTDHKYQIKYKTKFDTSVIDNGSGHEGDIKFVNDASMTWKDQNGGDHTNNDHKEFKPIPPFQYNGQKSGSYNATSKKITWTIAANFNQQELISASIIDPISDDQNYVSGSAKVYEATINKNGTYTLGAEVTSDMGIKIIESKGSVKVELPDGSTKAYVLIFETSLEGNLINQKEYKNKATFTNKDISHDLSASVTPAHQGEFVTKDGSQSSTDSNYVNWKLTVNASQSTLKNVEVTDNSSSNQYIVAKDILIYGTSIDASGNITENKNIILEQGKDYSVDIQTDNSTGAQTVKIKFLSEINTAYVVEYRALITSDKSNDVVSNQARITGDNEKTIEQDVEKDVPVINHNGSANGSKGSFTFEKVGPQKEKLAGAHLQLWSIGKDGKKDKLIREGDTDGSGDLKLGNLRVGDYLLIETKAPTGYTIDEELASGKKVTIAQDGKNSNFPLQDILNDPTKVVLKKFGLTIKNGEEVKNPLQGAEFEVLDSTGQVVSGYEKITSDNSGNVTIEKLLPGKYSLVEIKAPTGYILDPTPIEFELKANEEGIIPDINLEKVNYQGSAQLIKHDNNGQALSGAVFKVVDKDGKPIQTGLTSGKDGKVIANNLAPGEYSFVETQAPTGYILNTSPVHFTISDKEEGQPLSDAIFKIVDKAGNTIQSNLTSGKDGKVTVTGLAPGDYSFIETQAPTGYILNTNPVHFTISDKEDGQPKIIIASDSFVNYQGSAQLIKRDSQGQPLSGAIFKVVDNTGKLVKEGLTSDKAGKVNVTSLAPGDYSFIETQAPTGYVLNTKPIDFKILDESEGQPQLVVASDNFINYQGSAELIKHDINGQALSGAIFKVIDADGKTIKEGLTSDETGKVLIEGLAPGEYSFVETQAPKGYILNTLPVNFSISDEEEGEVKVVMASDNFINYQGSAELIKHDSQGQALEGAIFKVIDSKGKIIKEDLASDKTGKVLIDNLAPGDYSFVETKAPSGYILNTSKVDFTISTKEEGQPKVVMASDNFINYQGSAELIKHDSQGQALEGAIFKVIDSKGKIIKEDLASDKTGKVLIENLVPGDYSFVETKAPSGYILNTSKVDFTISAKEKNQPKIVMASDNFINYQGSAELIKVDENGKSLSGAVFNITNSETHEVVIKGVKTDANGVIKANYLKPGKYTFVETKAPKGYQLSQETRAFEIKASAENKPQVVNTGKFVNKKLPITPKKPELPKTGEERNTFLPIVGVGLLMVGATLYVFFKRRKM